MKKVGEFFNGKKTVIGLVLSAVVVYLTMEGYINANQATLFGSLSGIIFAGGVGHKIQKATKKD